jgi:hypothetical protein
MDLASKKTMSQNLYQTIWHSSALIPDGPLLNMQVYTSNMQLGGPSVMGVNGVSHYVVEDDLEGIKAILRWLSYAPPQVGAEPPQLPTSDPVERSVAYLPSSHEKLDPRAAIAGECSYSGRLCSAVFGSPMFWFLALVPAQSSSPNL